MKDQKTAQEPDSDRVCIGNIDHFIESLGNTAGIGNVDPFGENPRNATGIGIVDLFDESTRNAVVCRECYNPWLKSGELTK